MEGWKGKKVELEEGGGEAEERMRLIEKLKEGGGCTTEVNNVLPKSDKIVCLVCRRKFKDVETLKKHEEKSELHKTNLANLKKEEYRDRNGERKEIFYGKGKEKGKKAEKVEEKVEEKEKEKEMVEVENVGKKMLMKMGWRDGEKESDMIGRIRQEWDKNV